jgi:outer membrane protein OmpA-like peptidoglycan-associated protein
MTIRRPTLTLALAGSLAAALAGTIVRAASQSGPDFSYSSATTVSEAQGILSRAGYLAAGSYRRGEMDQPTSGALTRFQHAHGLRPTGRIDAETLTQLLQHEPPIIGGSLAQRGILFDAGSATLKAKAQADLDGVARSLRSNPHARLSIEGHADSNGTNARNEQLSKARADAVRDYLVSKGVSPSRLDTRGHGSRQPIADNDTTEGRAENRRVALARAG